jgi:hypothetical protein
MMTKNLNFIFLLLAFACGKMEAEKTASQLEITYEIDTIRIDAKGEFLFLNMDLFMSDYDAKNDLLHNLNPETSRMEVIDLEKNELKEVIQYDQDGPNAVKEMFTSGIKITDSGEKWFTDYYSLIHLDSSDQKIGQLRLTNDDLGGDTLPNSFEIDGMGKITNSGKYFVSHFGDYQTVGEGPKGLAVIELQSRTKKLFPIDVFKVLNKYDLAFSDGEKVRRSSSEWNFIALTDQNILHSNSAQNRLRVLVFASGEQREVQLKSNLLSKEKPGNYPKLANSMEQFEEFDQLKKQEVSFGRWVYDPDREYFWRIASEKKGGTIDTPVFEFVLTVLDKEFNQISEIPLKPEHSILFKSLPYLSFVRKGMLYLFLNVEDEMTFVRIKPKFPTP